MRRQNSLLDRGWGRPTQPLAGDADEPIVLTTAERQDRARQLIREAFAAPPMIEAPKEEPIEQPPQADGYDRHAEPVRQPPQLGRTLIVRNLPARPRRRRSDGTSWGA